MHRIVLEAIRICAMCMCIMNKCFPITSPTTRRAVINKLTEKQEQHNNKRDLFEKQQKPSNNNTNNTQTKKACSIYIEIPFIELKKNKITIPFWFRLMTAPNFYISLQRSSIFRSALVVQCNSMHVCHLLSSYTAHRPIHKSEAIYLLKQATYQINCTEWIDCVEQFARQQSKISSYFIRLILFDQLN